MLEERLLLAESTSALPVQEELLVMSPERHLQTLPKEPRVSFRLLLLLRLGLLLLLFLSLDYCSAFSCVSLLRSDDLLVEARDSEEASRLLPCQNPKNV